MVKYAKHIYSEKKFYFGVKFMIQDMTATILSIASTFIKLEDNSYIDSQGFWTKNSTVSSTFRGSMQPLTSEDLQHFKVGYIITGKSKIYIPISETTLEVKDKIQDVNLVTWIVTDIIDYSIDGGYKKYFAERESLT